MPETNNAEQGSEVIDFYRGKDHLDGNRRAGGCDWAK